MGQYLDSFIDWLVGLVSDPVSEFLKEVVAVACTPYTMDWASELTVAFQGIAVGIVVVIVIARGILTGILLEGGSEDESVGHFLFTSIVPIVLIAATPAITAMFVGAAHDMVGAFIPGGSGSLAKDVATSVMTPWNEFQKQKTANAFAVPPAQSLIQFILIIACCYYVVSICIQCAKRWIQLTILSVIAPLVAVMTSLEDSSDYIALLKSMLMIGVTTVLQIALLMSVGPLVTAGVSGSSIGATITMGVNPTVIPAYMLMIIGLSATKSVPDWIEKYTQAAGVAGHGNGASKMLYAGRGFGGRSSVARASAQAPAANAAICQAAR